MAGSDGLPGNTSRPTGLIHKQSIVDWLLVLWTIPAVAERGQRQVVALHGGGTGGTPNESPLVQMTLSEAGFNPGLAFVQPIHGWVPRLVVHIFESEFSAQTGGRTAVTETGGRGPLRGRVQDAADHECPDKVADPCGPGTEERIQLERPHRAERRGDVAMIDAANLGKDRVDGGVDLIDNRATFEESFDLQDDLYGEFGAMGPRGFDGLSIDPFGLSDELGGLVAAGWNFSNKHGPMPAGVVLFQFSELTPNSGIVPVKPLIIPDRVRHTAQVTLFASMVSPNRPISSFQAPIQPETGPSRTNLETGTARKPRNSRGPCLKYYKLQSCVCAKFRDVRVVLLVSIMEAA